MGCDIHCWAEVREGGACRKVGRIWATPWEWEEDGLTDEPYWMRNYDLFAMLAGVRNYDDAIIPLSLPRGLPADASSEVQAISDEYGRDGHSHSWHSLRHLLEYPQWDKTYSGEGLVSGSWYASHCGTETVLEVSLRVQYDRV